VVNHYSQVPFPAVYFSIVMNKDTWNGLPPDVQSAIMSVSGLAGSKFWGQNFFDNAKAVALEKIEASGNSDHIYSLSPEEQDHWLDIGGKPVWSEWIQRMEGMGFGNAQQILDAAIQLSETQAN
jgi:TRAP-type C4-dicarboxylate transport system substrate-binding protein